MLIVCSMVFMAAMCDKEEVEEFIDPCKESALSSTVDVSFVFSAYIYYKDDVPYEGPIHFKVHKAYCEGTISGEYYLTHIPSAANGGWFSGMLYTYTYTNYDDIVWTEFSFESPTYEIHKEIGAFNLGYVHLYWQGGPMEHTFQIHLPWNAPEAKN